MNSNKVNTRRTNSISTNSNPNNNDLRKYLENYSDVRSRGPPSNQPRSKQNQTGNEKTYHTDQAYENFIRQLQTGTNMASNPQHHQSQCQQPTVLRTQESNNLNQYLTYFNTPTHADSAYDTGDQRNQNSRLKSQLNVNSSPASSFRSSIYRQIEHPTPQTQYNDQSTIKFENRTPQKSHQRKPSYAITTNAHSPLQALPQDNQGTNESFCSFGADAEDKPNENLNSIKDILTKLKIERYLQVFESQEIENINDFLLLQREDLVEMNIPIGIRNRILAFNAYYKEHRGKISNEIRFEDMVYNTKQDNQHLGDSAYLTQMSGKSGRSSSALKERSFQAINHTRGSSSVYGDDMTNERNASNQRVISSQTKHVQQRPPSSQNNFSTQKVKPQQLFLERLEEKVNVNQKSQSREQPQRQVTKSNQKQVPPANLKEEVDQILSELSQIISKKEHSESKSFIQSSPMNSTQDNEIENINKEIRDFTKEYIQSVPHRVLQLPQNNNRILQPKIQDFNRPCSSDFSANKMVTEKAINHQQPYGGPVFDFSKIHRHESEPYLSRDNSEIPQHLFFWLFSNLQFSKLNLDVIR